MLEGEACVDDLVSGRRGDGTGRLVSDGEAANCLRALTSTGTEAALARAFERPKRVDKWSSAARAGAEARAAAATPAPSKRLSRVWRCATVEAREITAQPVTRRVR